MAIGTIKSRFQEETTNPSKNRNWRTYSFKLELESRENVFGFRFDMNFSSYVRWYVRRWQGSTSLTWASIPRSLPGMKSARLRWRASRTPVPRSGGTLWPAGPRAKASSNRQFSSKIWQFEMHSAFSQIRAEHFNSFRIFFTFELIAFSYALTAFPTLLHAICCAFGK